MILSKDLISAGYGKHHLPIEGKVIIDWSNAIASLKRNLAQQRARAVTCNSAFKRRSATRRRIHVCGNHGFMYDCGYCQWRTHDIRYTGGYSDCRYDEQCGDRIA